MIFRAEAKFITTEKLKIAIQVQSRVVQKPLNHRGKPGGGAHRRLFKD